MFYELKKNPALAFISNPEKEKFNLKIIPEFLIVAFLLCGWEALFVLSNNSFPFVIPHFDHTDYSTISQFLNLTGQENAFRESNLHDDAFKGLIPYHYFELWLNAAVARCFGLLYSTSLLLIIYPLFYFLFYLGVNAVWSAFGKITFYKRILSVLFLFFGAFCFPVYEKLPFVNQYFFGLVIKSFPIDFLAKKMICIYVFAIPALLLFTKKYYSFGFLFLLCLPLVFAATAPGIFIGGFVFILITYFLKWIPNNELKRSFFYLLIFSLFIFCLYKVFGNATFFTVEGNISELISNGNTALKKQWADVIWLGQTLPLQILLAYLPFIIIGGIFLISANQRVELVGFRTIILTVMIMIFAGAVTWAILLPVSDSFQFYSCIMPLFNMMCIFILIKMFSSADFTNAKTLWEKDLAYIFLFSVLIVQVTVAFSEQWERKQKSENIYSSDYILQIEKVKNQIKNPVGVCLYAKETPMLAPYRIQTGLYLKFIQGFENLVNISVLDREYENPLEKHQLKSSFFYFFVEKQKSDGKFKSIEQSQLDFINENKIDFVVAQKNSFVSPSIMQRAKSVIIDSKSQERFILLN
jgi:hypothetical protein